MIKYFLLFVVLSAAQFTGAQVVPEEEINTAYQNAKKGLYWALDNIPDKRAKMKNDLIDRDKLFASVTLAREVDGIKITSRGFNNSTEVVIKIYKSLKGGNTEKLKNELRKIPKEMQVKDSTEVKKQGS